MTVGYSKQKARARGKVIKKNPHRLFRADGGLKEGNGIGEPYAHLADICCKHGAKEVYPSLADPLLRGASLAILAGVGLQR